MPALSFNCYVSCGREVDNQSATSLSKSVVVMQSYSRINRLRSCEYLQVQRAVLWNELSFVLGVLKRLMCFATFQGLPLLVSLECSKLQLDVVPAASSVPFIGLC